MREEALIIAALLLAAPAGLGSKPAAKAEAAARPKPAATALPALEQRLKVLTPAVELPDDYAKVLQRASKARARLVILPIRRPGDGHEGAFELAELALESGLFAKVSVGDDLGNADYAVAGSWRSWSRHGGPDSQGKRTEPGTARWMWSGAELKLDLLYEGESFGSYQSGEVESELYLEPPFSPLQIARADHEGLRQAYRAALYRIAKDILKRSAR